MRAIVPTRDEAETIGQTVNDLVSLGADVTVVDSSVTNATMYAAVSAGAKYIDCTADGLGPAYAAGWADLNWAEWVVHVDAGGSHPLDSIKMVVAGIRYEADMVIGSRFVDGSRYVGNPRRRRMSKVAAFMCNLVSRYEYTDWTSGLRAYSPRARATLSMHTFQTKGHAWQIEALDVCARAGLVIREVPITYVAGRSHLSRARVREAARYWWRMWWI